MSSFFALYDNVPGLFGVETPFSLVRGDQLHIITLGMLCTLLRAIREVAVLRGCNVDGREDETGRRRMRDFIRRTTAGDRAFGDLYSPPPSSPSTNGGFATGKMLKCAGVAALAGIGSGDVIIADAAHRRGLMRMLAAVLAMQHLGTMRDPPRDAIPRFHEAVTT
jgi:hypothetical protein